MNRTASCGGRAVYPGSDASRSGRAAYLGSDASRNGRAACLGSDASRNGRAAYPGSDASRGGRADIPESGASRGGRAAYPGGGGLAGRRHESAYSRSAPRGNFQEDARVEAPDEGVQSRALRRARIRREREKKLRRMYISIGAAGILVLAFAVFLVPMALRRLRGNAGAARGTDTLLAGQEASADPYAEGATRDGAQAVPESDGRKEQDVAQFADGASLPEEEEAESGQDRESKPEMESRQEAETGREAGEDKAASAGLQGSAGGESQSMGEVEDFGTLSDSLPVKEPSDSASYARQDDWRLILVNHDHPLPEGYTVQTTSLVNGESVDSRCYGELTQMLQDCQAAGGTPIVCSSYRPHEKQVALFQAQVETEKARGKTEEEAIEAAGTVVARPGTSEHELGLAVDICDTYNQNLDETQADTPTQQWLMDNCWKYGFILRYPVAKSDITGIIYEPWHYRYVGKEAAAEIRNADPQEWICLEEYLSK